MLQPELLERVLFLLHKNEIEYMMTGSFVSSFQGEPRATHDVDIVLNITKAAIPALLNAFPPPRFYLSETAIEEALQHKSMFNLLDTTQGDKIDFWILTDEPFDQSRFARKYKETIFDYPLFISAPEDTILMKLNWAKLSGGSEKHFNDAMRVYEIQHEILDIPYMNIWAKKLDLEELWKKLKEESQPL